MKGMKLGLFVLAGCFAVLPVCLAQAPAGAPAGANGICKDGTYSTAASKDGACRGHKGVQTWYATTASAGSAGKPPASMPAPTPAPAASAPSQPAPARSSTPQNAMPATAPSAKPGPTAAAANKTAAPGGGPGLVWVNTSTNVYHCNGDAFYGKTKQGAYMSEADAKAKGAHGVRGGTCAGK